jgi:hypothetical protein
MQKVRGNAGFSLQEVARIKRDLLEGVSRKALATAWGCGLETIARIARGETWADVPPAEGAHVDTLEAEMLAPANLEGMADRLLAMQEKVQSVNCPGCESGLERVEGGHMTPYGIVVKCLSV